MQRFLLWERRNNTVSPFNETVQQVFARISALRDSLDGPQVISQPFSRHTGLPNAFQQTSRGWGGSLHPSLWAKLCEIKEAWWHQSMPPCWGLSFTSVLQMDDQGLVNTDPRNIAVPNTWVNLIPTDVRGLTFSRTPQMVRALSSFMYPVLVGLCSLSLRQKCVCKSNCPPSC